MRLSRAHRQRYATSQRVRPCCSLTALAGCCKILFEVAADTSTLVRAPEFARTTTSDPPSGLLNRAGTGGRCHIKAAETGGGAYLVSPVMRGTGYLADSGRCRHIAPQTSTAASRPARGHHAPLRATCRSFAHASRTLFRLPALMPGRLTPSAPPARLAIGYTVRCRARAHSHAVRPHPQVGSHRIEMERWRDGGSIC
jgi:hypothetical protein